jgi:hypothetical protein
MPRPGPLTRASLRVSGGALALWTLARIAAYFIADAGTHKQHVESALNLTALVLVCLFAARPADRAAARPDEAGPARCPASALVIAVFVCGSLALYWPALHVGFISDDFVLADRASRLALTGHVFVRPVLLLIWKGVLELGGGPATLHTVNILLHGVNAALFAAVARRVGLPPASSLLAAALFLVWPTQVEAVVWNSGMFDVLTGTFMLTIVLLYVGGAWRSTGGVIALFLLAMAALLTKETAGMLPVFIVLAAAPGWWRQRPVRRERVVAAALFLLCATYLIWRVFIRIGPTDGVDRSITRYVLKELLSRTFSSLSVPLTTDVTRAVPALGLLYGGIALVLIAAPVLLARARDGISWIQVRGSIWTLAAVLPAIGYLLVGPYMEGSRHLYLPSVGWFIAMVAGADALRRMAPRAGAIAAGALILLTAVSVPLTRRDTGDWTTAAALRDAVLARAEEFATRQRCRELRVSGVPEMYRGAQLFRNGFAEAVGPRVQVPGGAVCDVSWDGRDFQAAQTRPRAPGV